MEGLDKALALIGGERMIDRVLYRLRAQVPQVLLCAPHDYGTGATAVADLADGPAGPVGAIRAMALYLAAQGADGFVTAPVDAPFVPLDLVTRLGEGAPVAMAQCDGTWQPAFALWNVQAVIMALPADRCVQKWSLRRLGEELGAVPVEFAEAGVLTNVNTPQELAQAQAQIASESAGSGAV
ncbi:molybdenum cofactor guanylyltransferase [Blastomonas aquatica]|uniref:Molybdenum cofactor guanylyltransferase n=2 Tax=Blastomonas aquatica TaxID=1510276 RepID=A0ABQ1IZG8_9SPHN|nr:molybdenum cofactor guanylyltransferase [Blastomonas aquatica]